MDKRKIQYGIVVLMLAFVFVGCGQKKRNDVKVYENTEEVTAEHEEASVTAIITSMDMENNQMHFVSVLDGTDITLQYHGGVRVTDTKGADIGIDRVLCGYRKAGQHREEREGKDIYTDQEVPVPEG